MHPCFPKEKLEENKRNLGQIWKQMPHPRFEKFDASPQQEAT